jgi:hypothetical protein
MKTLKEILIRELGGIGGSGVQTKDGHGPYSGGLDPDYDELRDALTTEIPARTSPAHGQMTRPQDRPTGVGGRTPTGTADFDPEAIGTAGSAFLPPGVTPAEFDDDPYDRGTPKSPTIPGKVGPGLSRPRAGRQTMDPTKMLSPAELQQAKKQLGLEGMPDIKDIDEKKKGFTDMTARVERQKQAKKENWVLKILQAVPELQRYFQGASVGEWEKALELAFQDLETNA